MPVSQVASAQPWTSARTCSGRASVVRSRSSPRRPSSASRTEPPTRCSAWPAAAKRSPSSTSDRRDAHELAHRVALGVGQGHAQQARRLRHGAPARATVRRCRSSCASAGGSGSSTSSCAGRTRRWATSSAAVGGDAGGRVGVVGARRLPLTCPVTGSGLAAGGLLDLDGQAFVPGPAAGAVRGGGGAGAGRRGAAGRWRPRAGRPWPRRRGPCSTTRPSPGTTARSRSTPGSSWSRDRRPQRGRRRRPRRPARRVAVAGAGRRRPAGAGRPAGPAAPRRRPPPGRPRRRRRRHRARDRPPRPAPPPGPARCRCPSRRASAAAEPFASRRWSGRWCWPPSWSR